MSTEQYTQQLAEQLARVFSALLLYELDDQTMEQVIERNRAMDNDPRVCHSHDFCDANMVMDTAFKAVTGKEYEFGNDADTDLTNNAWDTAKANNFYFDFFTKD